MQNTKISCQGKIGGGLVDLVLVGDARLRIGAFVLSHAGRVFSQRPLLMKEAVEASLGMDIHGRTHIDTRFGIRNGMVLVRTSGRMLEREKMGKFIVKGGPKKNQVEAVQWMGDFIVNGSNIAPDWVTAALKNYDLFFQDQGDLYINADASSSGNDIFVPCPGYIMRNSSGLLSAYTLDRFSDEFEPVVEQPQADRSRTYAEKLRDEYCFLDCKIKELENTIARKKQPGPGLTEMPLLEMQHEAMCLYQQILQARALEDNINLKERK